MAKKSKLSVLVQFGGVSISQETAKVGVSIERSTLDLLDADQYLCGKRLVGKIILGRRDDADGQAKLIEDTDFEVGGAFDVKRFGVSPTKLSAGLTFALASIDVRELARFAKGAGRMVVDEIQELPDDEEDEFEPADVDDEPNEALRTEGPWRKFKLKDLFKGKLLKCLDDAGLKTVGDLHEYQASEKRLTDIPDVGPAAEQKIGDVMLEFWKANPQFSDDEALATAK